MTPRVVVVAVTLLAGTLAARQDPQTQRPPTFRTGLELVRVDAAVVDRSGKPVRDLTADDFAITEDGVPQRIETFKLVELNGQQAADDPLSLAVTSRGHAATEVARDDVRAFLVFWDDYHIPLLPAAVILRDALKKFLREGLGPTDMVAVMTQWTPADAIEFTRERERLAFDTRLLEGRFRNYTPRNGAEENHMRAMRNVDLIRAQVSITALKSAIVQLGAMKEGRKALLYFSREYGLGRNIDNAHVLNDLIRTANDANVAFYSINPDGVSGMRRYGLLSDLALNTGGEALRTNVPVQALKQAVEQSSAVYLLGYSPTPLRQDGKFHKISVKVKNRRLEVRARSGYWAPDAATKAQALAVAKAATAAITPPIERALGELARLEAPDTAGPDRFVRTIVSPDPPDDVLGVEAVRVWQVRRPAELTAVLGAEPPAPTTERAFPRTDRLIIRFALAGDLSASAAVSVALLGARGARLTTVQVKASEDGTTWLIDLPLSSIARGDYLVAIEAVSGTTRASAYVPIRITSG